MSPRMPRQSAPGIRGTGVPVPVHRRCGCAPGRGRRELPQVPHLSGQSQPPAGQRQQHQPEHRSTWGTHRRLGWHAGTILRTASTWIPHGAAKPRNNSHEKAGSFQMQPDGPLVHACSIPTVQAWLRGIQRILTAVSNLGPGEDPSWPNFFCDNRVAKTAAARRFATHCVVSLNGHYPALDENARASGLQVACVIDGRLITNFRTGGWTGISRVTHLTWTRYGRARIPISVIVKISPLRPSMPPLIRA